MASQVILALLVGLYHIYSMRNKKMILLCAFLFIFYSGCATRDNTDFHLFTVQTAILIDETAASFESARLLAELNISEAIADGNTELLEYYILQREGPFTLKTDSLSLTSGLIDAENDLANTGHAIADYSILLDEISRSESTLFQLIPTSSPNTSLLAAAIAVLVEQGKTEHDAEIISTSMLAAAPAMESISFSMAELTQAVANTVQASYADMVARRQMNIIMQNNSLENIEEIFTLNRQATSLLGKLELLNESWKSIPAVHEELRSSLFEASVSVSLRVLAERMNEIREEGK